MSKSDYLNTVNFKPTDYTSSVSASITSDKPKPQTKKKEEESDKPVIEGYKPQLRNRIQVMPVQETVQAKTVYKPVLPTVTPKSTTKGIIISDGIDVGKMQHILDKFAEAGINIRVTSGVRKSGQAGKAGNKSHHITDNAIDIVPGKGETFESMREKIKNNPELLQYFRDNKIGIIDETTEDVMKRTGASGAHWHIGPDRLALSGFETMFAKQGGSMPSRIDMLVAKFNEQFNK